MVAQPFPYTFQSLEFSCSFLVAEPRVTFHCNKSLKSQLFLYASDFDHVTHLINTFVSHETQQNGWPGIPLHIPIIRISVWLSEGRAARNQWLQENCNNCNNCNKKSKIHKISDMCHTLITWHTSSTPLFETKLNKMLTKAFSYTFQSLELSYGFLVPEPRVTFHCNKTATKCLK